MRVTFSASVREPVEDLPLLPFFFNLFCDLAVKAFELLTELDARSHTKCPHFATAGLLNQTHSCMKYTQIRSLE